MELKNCELLPGVVVVDKDPKHIGRVKAVVPTLFDTRTMDKELLPWIYPFTMSGYQSYFAPRNGMKIWVLNNKDNYHEYWYFPMFELCCEVKDKSENTEETDVIMSRNMGNGYNTMSHSQADGFVTQINDNVHQISPDGTLTYRNKEGNGLRVSAGNVTLGTNGTFDEDTGVNKNVNGVAMGDNVKSLIAALEEKINSLAKKISESKSPYDITANVLTWQQGDGKENKIRDMQEFENAVSTSVKITK